jgi:hypothetical protein
MRIEGQRNKTSVALYQNLIRQRAKLRVVPKKDEPLRCGGL